MQAKLAWTFTALAAVALLAPITATDAGAKNEPRFLTVIWKLSCLAENSDERDLSGLDLDQKPLCLQDMLPISGLLQFEARTPDHAAVTQT